MTILSNTLLANHKVHAIPASIGKINRPLPVNDRLIEVDVAPIRTFVSTASINVFKVLKILYLFSDLLFVSLKYVFVSSMWLIWLIKLFTSF